MAFTQHVHPRPNPPHHHLLSPPPAFSLQSRGLTEAISHPHPSTQTHTHARTHPDKRRRNYPVLSCNPPGVVFISVAAYLTPGFTSVSVPALSLPAQPRPPPVHSPHVRKILTATSAARRGKKKKQNKTHNSGGGADKIICDGKRKRRADRPPGRCDRLRRRQTSAVIVSF